MNLDKGPVGHPAVTGDREEVEVAVQVIPCPLDLPHHVPVLAQVGVGEEGRNTDIGPSCSLGTAVRITYKSFQCSTRSEASSCEEKYFRVV